nr:immunoglobulin heavy chain junction region [Mus musculus]MBK4183953.1 immunoglobulin heavy chain junction region [Mus musculus]
CARSPIFYSNYDYW